MFGDMRLAQPPHRRCEAGGALEPLNRRDAGDLCLPTAKTDLLLKLAHCKGQGASLSALGYIRKVPCRSRAPSSGPDSILCRPVLGGLHHQYVRILIYDGGKRRQIIILLANCRQNGGTEYPLLSRLRLLGRCASNEASYLARQLDSYHEDSACVLVCSQELITSDYRTR